MENDDGLIQVPNKHSLRTHKNTHFMSMDANLTILTSQVLYLLQNTAYDLNLVFMIETLVCSALFHMTSRQPIRARFFISHHTIGSEFKFVHGYLNL